MATLAEVGGLRACSFRATTLTMYSSPGFSPVWLKDVTSLGSWAMTPPSLFCVGEGRRRENKSYWERKVFHCLLNCDFKMGTPPLPSMRTAERLGSGPSLTRLREKATPLGGFGKWRKPIFKNISLAFPESIEFANTN